MKKMYYVAGAAVIALAGLGIYATQAQNNDPANTDGGVLIIEEESYAVQPADSGVSNGAATTGNAASMPADTMNPTGVQANPAANNVNNRLNTNVPADFQPLPGDPGVDVAPDNQPVVDKAMKNQNPTYNPGVVVEEGVIETAN